MSNNVLAMMFLTVALLGGMFGLGYVAATARHRRRQADEYERLNAEALREALKR